MKSETNVPSEMSSLVGRRSVHFAIFRYKLGKTKFHVEGNETEL